MSSLPRTNVRGNCPFRVFQKKLQPRRIVNVRSHERRQHVIDPLIGRRWGLATLLLEVAERARAGLELAQLCQIIPGYFWPDQPLRCGILLRHGATVTTVRWRGWRRASTSTVEDMRRLVGRPRAFGDAIAVFAHRRARRRCPRRWLRPCRIVGDLRKQGNPRLYPSTRSPGFRSG